MKNKGEPDENGEVTDEETENESESESEETPSRNRLGMFAKGNPGGPGRGKARMRMADGSEGRMIGPTPLSRKQAAARLKVAPGTLKKMEKDGRVHPEQDEDGRWWFDPEEIEDLAEEAYTDELGASQLLEAAKNIIEQQIGHHEAMAKTMTDMIEQTGKREASMMGAFLLATNKILEIQTQWAGQALERASKLEVELDQSRDAIETALSNNLQRELTVADAEARQRRNDALMRQITAHVPTALALVAKKFGATPEDATSPLIKDLMDTITPEQAQGLMAANILSQDQLAKLFVVWEQTRTKETPST